MKTGTVLLVEDSPTDEALTLRALKKSGLANEIAVARDGAEALDYLFCTGPYSNRCPADITTLVLLDLNLPKIGGHEVLKRIRGAASTRLLPVVILTSSGQEQDIIESYGLGVNGYVRKPVESNEFSNAVQQLGLYWLLLNENPPPHGKTPAIGGGVTRGLPTGNTP
jgi:two-component system response regulator